MADRERTPEPYEPGPPETKDPATPKTVPPSREHLVERNKRFGRPRKPMGPKPEDDRRRALEEHGAPADVPPTPAPEPPPEPADS